MTQTGHSNEIILTVKEAANYLRISRASLYRHRKDRKLKELRAGGKVLFDKEDLIKFLNSNSK